LPFLEPFEGLPLTLKALTVIILAGVESLPGILAASVVLGLAEVIGSYFLGSIWAPVIGYGIFFLSSSSGHGTFRKGDRMREKRLGWVLVLGAVVFLAVLPAFSLLPCSWCSSAVFSGSF